MVEENVVKPGVKKLTEKVVTIPWGETTAKVTIRRMNFGERNELLNNAVKIKMHGRVPMQTLDSSVLKENSMLHCIVDAPFEVSMAGIKKLDPDIGEFLYAEIDELNTISPQKKEPSGGQSSTEPKTETSPVKSPTSPLEESSENPKQK